MPMQIRPRRSHRKRPPLVHLATRVFETPLCILRAKLDVILQAIGPRLLGVDSLPIVALDGYDDEQAPEYQVQNGVATISIYGTLVQRSSGMDASSGLTSYDTLTQLVSSAVADSDVKAIIFDTDSGGGEVTVNGKVLVRHRRHFGRT